MVAFGALFEVWGKEKSNGEAAKCAELVIEPRGRGMRISRRIGERVMKLKSKSRQSAGGSRLDREQRARANAKPTRAESHEMEICFSAKDFHVRRKKAVSQVVNGK